MPGQLGSECGDSGATVTGSLSAAQWQAAAHWAVSGSAWQWQWAAPLSEHPATLELWQAPSRHDLAPAQLEVESSGPKGL
jgi:hypothetical protein